MVSRIRILSLLLLAATTAAAIPPPLNHRVLVPISIADVPGANGALWTAELWAVNADGSGESALIEPLPCLIAPPPANCAATFALPPGRSTKIPPYGSSAQPGVLMRVPAHLALRTFFTLHVRDLKRQAESWGAEIPVVRERDFFTGTSQMVNVPFGGDYRQTLRVYAILDNQPSVRFRVKLYQVTGTADDHLVSEQVITLELPPAPPPNVIPSPLAQITLTDLFAIEIAEVERVRVTIEPMTEATALLPPIPYWAFVSITNNHTQQVTTVTPR